MQLYLYLTLFMLSASSAQALIFWDYDGTRTGQEEWGNLAQEFATCSDGKAQSPVSISHTATAKLPPMQFDYKAMPTTFRLDRYSVVSLPAEGLTLREGTHLWRLKEMLVRTPSEHDVEGNYYPMELQFFHEDSDKKQLAVSVFMQRGHINPALQTIIDHFPKNLKDRPGADVDWARLIPGMRGYYSYSGSLATPPCTEGVEIRVLKTPIEASEEQLAWLAAKFNRNARTTQPVLMRMIRESE